MMDLPATQSLGARVSSCLICRNVAGREMERLRTALNWELAPVIADFSPAFNAEAPTIFDKASSVVDGAVDKQWAGVVALTHHHQPPAAPRPRLWPAVPACLARLAKPASSCVEHKPVQTQPLRRRCSTPGTGATSSSPVA